MPITWASRVPTSAQLSNAESETNKPRAEAAGSFRLVPLVKRETDSPNSIHSESSEKWHDIKGDLPPARKYQWKPEPIKASVVYQTKRAKNNESVRRCRANAKKMQEELEDRVIVLELENQQLKLALQRKEEEISRMKDEEINRLKTEKNRPIGRCKRRHVDDANPDNVVIAIPISNDHSMF